MRAKRCARAGEEWKELRDAVQVTSSSAIYVRTSC